MSIRIPVILAIVAAATSAGDATAQLPRARALTCTLAIPRAAWVAANCEEPSPAVHNGIRPLQVAKWTTLGAAVVAAAYGYNENRLADSRFEDLDRLCQQQPVRCTPRTASGSYVDAELESRYQEVRKLDRRATVGLVGAEVGLAAAVGMFLLDLRNAGREPPDIPYKPPKLEVGTSRSGGLRVGYRVLR